MTAQNPQQMVTVPREVLDPFLRIAPHVLHKPSARDGQVVFRQEEYRDGEHVGWLTLKLADFRRLAMLAASPPAPEDMRERVAEVISRAECKRLKIDPEESVEAGDPIGNPAEYPQWMLGLPWSRGIADALIEAGLIAALSPVAVAGRGEPTHDERVAYEERILAAEMRAERLKRLVRQPDEPGGYVGDSYYPVGGTEASHEWDGTKWNWLPNLLNEEVE